MRLTALFALALTPCFATERHHMDIYRTIPRRSPIATMGIVAVALGTTAYGAMLPCKCYGSDTVHAYPETMEGGHNYSLTCGAGYAPFVYRRQENGTTVAGWQRNASATCTCERGHGLLQIDRPCEPVRTCTGISKTGHLLRIPFSSDTDTFDVEVVCTVGYKADSAAPGEPEFPYAIPCTEDSGPIELVGCIPDPIQFIP